MNLPLLIDLSPLIVLVIIWALYVKQHGWKLPRPTGPDNGAGPWVSTALLIEGVWFLYKPWLNLPHERTRLLTIALFMILIAGLAFLQTLRNRPHMAWGKYSCLCVSAFLCSMAINAVLKP